MPARLRSCCSSTVGGSVDAWIHDLLDDAGGGHYGYGVEARGGTRGLRVGGRIERVRHAFTTNGAWNALVKSMLNTGEPEDCHVAPVVRDTTSVGLDTHEPGLGDHLRARRRERRGRRPTAG